MANTKSAQKAQRQSERRAIRNLPIRSSVKTYVKKATAAVATADGEATEAVRLAVRALDKAAQKGIIHHNNAARRKSRLMRHLSAVMAGTATSEVTGDTKRAKKPTRATTRKTTTSRKPSTDASARTGRVARAQAATRAASSRAARPAATVTEPATPAAAPAKPRAARAKAAPKAAAPSAE